MYVWPIAMFREQEAMPSFVGYRAIEGQQLKSGLLCECDEIGICPNFGSNAAYSADRAKGHFEAGRLFDKANSIILKPFVINLTGLHLHQYFILMISWS